MVALAVRCFPPSDESRATESSAGRPRRLVRAEDLGGRRGACSRMGGVKRPGEPPSADEAGLVESTTQGTSKRLRHTPPTSPCTSAQPAGVCPICRCLLVQKCTRAALHRLPPSAPRSLATADSSRLLPPALPPRAPTSRSTLRRSPVCHLCHLSRPPAARTHPSHATVAGLLHHRSRVRQATSA